jgi:ethanolamine permease
MGLLVVLVLAVVIARKQAAGEAWRVPLPPEDEIEARIPEALARLDKLEATDQRKSSGQLAGQIVGALLYMAVFGAVISYAMQCLSFILLRRRLPNIARPYRSPVGRWGAGIAGVIALVSLYSNADYRPGVYGTLIYFVLGIVYFAVAGRKRLVLSPEEELALTSGEHGHRHPETEGYGSTHLTDIPAADQEVAKER